MARDSPIFHIGTPVWGTLAEYEDGCFYVGVLGNPILDTFIPNAVKFFHTIGESHILTAVRINLVCPAVLQILVGHLVPFLHARVQTAIVPVDGASHIEGFGSSPVHNGTIEDRRNPHMGPNVHLYDELETGVNPLEEHILCVILAVFG
jgi:hypothetical protein